MKPKVHGPFRLICVQHSTFRPIRNFFLANKKYFFNERGRCFFFLKKNLEKIGSTLRNYGTLFECIQNLGSVSSCDISHHMCTSDTGDPKKMCTQPYPTKYPVPLFLDFSFLRFVPNQISYTPLFYWIFLFLCLI